MRRASLSYVSSTGAVAATTTRWLLNQQIALTFFERTPVAVDLPTVVVLKVTEAEMSAKGNTVNQDKKRAVCETGLEIKVPPFIDAGEYIKVSTETGEFMSRAKETDL